MRAPDGVEHWARGHVRRGRALRPARASISSSRTRKAMRCSAPSPKPNFADALGGTQLDVTQTYTVHRSGGGLDGRGRAAGLGADARQSLGARFAAC